MKKLTLFIISLAFFAFPFLAAPTPTHAADIRTGEVVTIGTDSANLTNLYLFGETISLTAPVQDDLITGGNKVDIDSPVGQSAMVAGGNVTIKNTVGNSLRVAGGNVTIDGTINKDLLVAGGNIIVTKNAKINGDMLFAGGTLTMDGTVVGKMLFSGGQMTINGTIEKGLQGNVGQLTIGPSSVINGDLRYSSEKKATVQPGAKITGETVFDEQKHEKRNESGKAFGAIGTWSLYKLIVDIIIGLLALYFFKPYLLAIFKQMQNHPFKNMSIGFVYLWLFPVAAVFLFILLWLGFAAFLFYGLTLLVANVIAQLFTGWKIMQFMTGKGGHTSRGYEMDWKAVVAGAATFFILSLIPLLGWLAVAILFLLSLGSLVHMITLGVQRKN